MGRALIVITSAADRRRAGRWVLKAPAGTRVEFKASKRSLDQNAKMWVLLSEVAAQATHLARRYTADQWKVLFLHACGREVQFLPALDGSTFIPWGQRSSDLSRLEMSELIEFILAWGTQHGVVFHEPSDGAPAAAPAATAAADGGAAPIAPGPATTRVHVSHPDTRSVDRHPTGSAPGSPRQDGRSSLRPRRSHPEGKADTGTAQNQTAHREAEL